MRLQGYDVAARQDDDGMRDTMACGMRSGKSAAHGMNAVCKTALPVRSGTAKAGREDDVAAVGLHAVPLCGRR